MLNGRLIQSIRDGIDVTLTNIPIGHDGSLQISRHHLRENKFEGVEKNCIVLSTGQAIGRVEECAWVSTNQCIFNSIYNPNTIFMHTLFNLIIEVNILIFLKSMVR